MYIIFLCNIKISDKIITYADSPAIIVHVKPLLETFYLATQCVVLVSTWVKYNKLHINCSKTLTNILCTTFLITEKLGYTIKNAIK